VINPPLISQIQLPQDLQEHRDPIVLTLHQFRQAIQVKVQQQQQQIAVVMEHHNHQQGLHLLQMALLIPLQRILRHHFQAKVMDLKQKSALKALNQIHK